MTAIYAILKFIYRLSINGYYNKLISWQCVSASENPGSNFESNKVPVSKFQLFESFDNIGILEQKIINIPSHIFCNLLSSFLILRMIDCVFNGFSLTFPTTSKISIERCRGLSSKNVTLNTSKNRRMSEEHNKYRRKLSVKQPNNLYNFLLTYTRKS